MEEVCVKFVAFLNKYHWINLPAQKHSYTKANFPYERKYLKGLLTLRFLTMFYRRRLFTIQKREQV